MREKKEKKTCEKPEAIIGIKTDGLEKKKIKIFPTGD